MNKKQIIEALAPYPDNMDVFMAERRTEFTYGLVNSVSKKQITFGEDPNGKPMAVDTVIILDEE